MKAKAEKDTGGRSDGGRFRPNSTSSIYISSTLSVPDNDEIMLSVSTVLQCIILQGEDAESKHGEATPKKVKDKPVPPLQLPLAHHTPAAKTVAAVIS